jgi:hypothetical protein
MTAVMKKQNYGPDVAVSMIVKLLQLWCRNVLRATIEVPKVGEVNFHCTHLDHLDESWRMKQLNAMLRSVDGPHILAGGLNALDGTDYSAERWADIVKVPTAFFFSSVKSENLRSSCAILTLLWFQYYEEIGKPTPKVEVMKYLKGKQYVDAKDFAGECEAVVVVAKGQGRRRNATFLTQFGMNGTFVLSSSPFTSVLTLY